MQQEIPTTISIFFIFVLLEESKASNDYTGKVPLKFIKSE